MQQSRSMYIDKITEWRSLASGWISRKKCLLLVSAMTAILPIPVSAAQTMQLNVLPVVADGSAQTLSRLPSDQVLTLSMLLPLRDEADLDGLVHDLYDPSSPSYRNYLTIDQFAERFGPSASDYEALTGFIAAHHLHVVGGSRAGRNIDFAGLVADIEVAFGVQMNLYRYPGGTGTFYAPDRPISVSLPAEISQLSGLHNFSRRAVAQAISNVASRKMPTSTTVASAGTGSGPGGMYIGVDLRAAYAGHTDLTGKGQRVAVMNTGCFDPEDFVNYYTYIQEHESTRPLTQPEIAAIRNQAWAYFYQKINVIAVKSNPGLCSSALVNAGMYQNDDSEPILDLTMVLAMAPEIDKVDYYHSGVGPSWSSFSAVVSNKDASGRPINTVIADSSGLDSSQSGGNYDGLNQNADAQRYFKQMAAQGQTYVKSAGDSAQWGYTNNGWQCDSAYALCVGGTSLITYGPAQGWRSETYSSTLIAGGGGVSPNGIPLPDWQAIPGVITDENWGSRVYRNGPDVSAASDNIYACFDRTCNVSGGTSSATPIIAGFLALVNEARARKHLNPIGFLNPGLYARNADSHSSDFENGFHHGLVNVNPSVQAWPPPSTAGFNLLTGWGSPKPGLIDILNRDTEIPPGDCRVDYEVTRTLPNPQPGRYFQARITIHNTGNSLIGPWQLQWIFPGTQKIIGGEWGASFASNSFLDFSPSGNSPRDQFYVNTNNFEPTFAVVAGSLDHSAAIPPGGSAAMGFDAFRSAYLDGQVPPTSYWGNSASDIFIGENYSPTAFTLIYNDVKGDRHACRIGKAS